MIVDCKFDPMALGTVVARLSSILPPVERSFTPCEKKFARLGEKWLRRLVVGSCCAKCTGKRLRGDENSNAASRSLKRIAHHTGKKSSPGRPFLFIHEARTGHDVSFRKDRPTQMHLGPEVLCFVGCDIFWKVLRPPAAAEILGRRTA